MKPVKEILKGWLRGALEASLFWVISIALFCYGYTTQDVDEGPSALVAAFYFGVIAFAMTFSFHARVFIQQFSRMEHDAKISKHDRAVLEEMEEKRRLARQNAKVSDCLGCGYDLSGSVAAGKRECPECGRGIDIVQRYAIEKRQ